MAGQIVKAKAVRNFVQITNKVAQNHELSWQALGLLTYILSLPDDWVIYKTQLYKLRQSNGRHSTDAAFDELVKSGHIYSVEKRDSQGHFKGFDYIIYHEPPEIESPIAGFPQSGFPQSGNQHLQRNTITNKHSTNLSPDAAASSNKENSHSLKNPSLPLGKIGGAVVAGVSDGFDAFWSAYDKKTGKDAAMRAWVRLKQADREAAMKGIPKYKASRDKIYRKDPERYLKHRTWEDEVLINNNLTDKKTSLEAPRGGYSN